MRIRAILPLLALATLFTACSDEGPTLLTPSPSAQFSGGMGEGPDCALGLPDEEALAEIDALLEEVDALEESGALNRGQARALRNHLNNARQQIEAGRSCPALAQLQAFREQVGNFVEDGVLTEEEAAPLLEGVSGVIDGPGEEAGLSVEVAIDPPSASAGVYPGAGASFGPAPTVEGASGDVILVDDGTEVPTHGCEPLVGFPDGAIALLDRGTCPFVQKVGNAQAAGAVAVIVRNNVAGAPATMGGTDPTIEIPAVMVSLADGTVIEAGIPATGTVRRTP
jgi:hypothetical protein